MAPLRGSRKALVVGRSKRRSRQAVAFLLLSLLLVSLWLILWQEDNHNDTKDTEKTDRVADALFSLY